MEALSRLGEALAARYTIQGEIDRGGMAAVFRAHDLKHDRPVAIKVLKPELAEAIGAARFLREIRTTANLSHPHILPLFDSGEAAGLLFYVMPFVEGESLRDRLAREGPLPMEDAVRITGEIADALDYAHDRGVIHRDVKPGNIMLERGHALLMDFGIAQARARAEEATLTLSGMSPGTPAYMSPEQISGETELEGRSDQYALACVLYEMLAGRPPFSGESTQALLTQHLAKEPPPVTDHRSPVPAAVSAALRRALAKQPEDRFPSLGEFGLALRGAGEAMGHPSPLRINPRWIAAAGAILLLGLALLWVGEPRGVGPSPSGERPSVTVLSQVQGNAGEDLISLVSFVVETQFNLAQTFRTVARPDIDRTLRLMDRPASTPLDVSTARELATRLGVSTVTLPRLDDVDGSYLFVLRVEDRETGEQRAAAMVQAESGADLGEAVTTAVFQVQEALGATPEAMARTQRFPDVVTPSLEALSLYLRGRNLVWSGSYHGAIPLLQEAVALDSTFAMAWHMLGMAYQGSGLGDSALAARARRDRYPERLSDTRRADAEFWGDRDQDVAYWDQAYERYAAAIQAQIEDNVIPDFASNYALALAQISWMDSAYSTLLHAHRRHVDQLRREDPDLELWYMCMQIPFINSTAWAADRGGIPWYLSFLDSLDLVIEDDCLAFAKFREAISLGDWNRADSLRRVELLPVLDGPVLTGNNRIVAEGMSRQMEVVRGRIGAHHNRLVAAGRSQDALILEVVYGIASSLEAEAGMQLGGRDLPSVRAFIRYGARSALVGDTLESARVLRELEALRAQATSDRFERAFEPWFTLMRAGPAFQAQDWTRVIAVLEPDEERFRAQGYGFGSGDTLLISWLLAQAYEQIGRPEDAISRLQDVIGLPRYRGGDAGILGLPYPAAQLALGRLYLHLGARDEAAGHFQTFLSVFTEPESEFLWMVEEAREGLRSLGIAAAPESAAQQR